MNVYYYKLITYSIFKWSFLNRLAHSATAGIQPTPGVPNHTQPERPITLSAAIGPNSQTVSIFS